MLTARPTPAPRASRRAVLGGGAAILVAGTVGCGARSSGDPADAPPADADSDLVDRVVEQVAETLSLALSTGASAPASRPLTRRFAALHRAHLEELGQPDDGITAGRAPGSPATARARLLRAEERLQQRLVTAALDAESGALAQVFASMAAGIAQQRAVAS